MNLEDSKEEQMAMILRGEACDCYYIKIGVVGNLFLEFSNAEKLLISQGNEQEKLRYSCIRGKFSSIDCAW